MYFILHVSYVSRGENFLYLKKTCIIKTATQKMYCMNANRQHEEDIQTKGRNGQMLHQRDATGHSSTSPSAPAGRRTFWWPWWGWHRAAQSPQPLFIWGWLGQAAVKLICITFGFWVFWTSVSLSSMTDIPLAFLFLLRSGSCCFFVQFLVIMLLSI